MWAHVMVIAVHTPFHVWCHTPFSWYHFSSLFCTLEHFWATFDQNWARFESDLCIFVIMFSHGLICFLLLSHMGCFKNKDWSRPNKSVVLDDLGGLLVMNGELIMAPSCSTAVMFFVEELSCSFQNQTHIYIYTQYVHIHISSNDNLKPSRGVIYIDLNSEAKLLVNPWFCWKANQSDRWHT